MKQNQEKITGEKMSGNTTREQTGIVGKVGVFGAGWLGAPLVVYLLKQKFGVNASVCSASGKQRLWHCLKDNGVLGKINSKMGANGAKNEGEVKSEFDRVSLPAEQFQLSMLTASGEKLDGNEEHKKRFYSGDLQVLVLCFPPGRAEGGGYEAYKEAVCHVVAPLLTNDGEGGNRSETSQVDLPWVVFVSSTSVYGKKMRSRNEQDDFFDEKNSIPFFTEKDTPSPVTRGGQAVWEAEQALRKLLGRRLVCLRCAGLVGKDRHPSRFLRRAKTGKRDFKTSGVAEYPINLVVQEDAVAVLGELVVKLARQNFVPPNEVYNIAANSHPCRSEFYRVAESAQDERRSANNSLQTNDEKAKRGGGKARERSGLAKCIDSTLAREELEFKPLYDDLLLWAKSN